MSQSEFSRSPQQPARRSPIVALVIVVALCLIAFSLGIFVGKQRQKIVAPEQGKLPVPHQVASEPNTLTVAEVVTQVQEDAAAPSMDSEAEVVGERAAAQLDVADPTLEQSPDIDPLAQQVLSVAQSPLGNGINSAPVMPKVSKVAAEVATVVAPEVAPVVVAEQVVSPVAPAESVTAPTVQGGAVYVVQVGSFKSRSDAEKLQQKLQKDYTVLVRQVDLGAKGVWFRVLVGASATKQAATKLQEQLLSQYKMSGFVKKTTL